MSAWLWAGVLIAAVWAAHWGAERMAKPLQMLRRQWGISAAAGGALIGIASASPEIGVNSPRPEGRGFRKRGGRLAD